MAEQPRLSKVMNIKNLLSRNTRRRGPVEFVAPSKTRYDDMSIFKPVIQPRLEMKTSGKDTPIRITTVELSDWSADGSPTRNAPQWPVRWEESNPSSEPVESQSSDIESPREKRRHRRTATLSSEDGASPANRLDMLPRDIMHYVVFVLKEMHCPEGDVVVQELRQDLSSLSKVSRRWNRVASEHLYDEIWLPSNEDARGRRITAVKPQSQLRCLRRTLEEDPRFSLAVRQLRVPYNLSKEILDQSSPASVRHGHATLDLIAEIISHCPSLEVFTGFYSPDCAGHTAVWNVLSSRPMLKSHCWALNPEWDFNTRNIVDYHMNWQNLETLAISDSQLGTGVLFGILWFLPSLKHLMLRRLSGSGIHCGTLMMLPALKSLRLEGLQGISDDGLEKLVSPKLAESLVRLTLVDMDVMSMTTIQTLMAGLLQLRRFALRQTISPDSGFDHNIQESEIDVLLRSNTLQELCWRTSSPGYAVPVIASSINAGGFPRLQRVKMPGACTETIRSCLDEKDGQTFEQPVAETWVESQLRSMAHLFGTQVGNLASNINYFLDQGKSGHGSVVADFGSAIVPDTRGVRDRMLDLHSLF